MLVSHKAIHVSRLGANYRTHMALHPRYRVCVEVFDRVFFDGSILKRAIAHETATKNWLVVPLVGEVHVGTRSGEHVLQAGSCLVEWNANTEFLRYRPSVNLMIEWEPGFWSTRLLPPHGPFAFDGRTLARLRRAAAPLYLECSDTRRAAAAIAEIVAILRAEGFPFDPVDGGDLSAPLPPWMAPLSAALDRSFSDLARATHQDLQDRLGWSAATLRRRLAAFRTRFSYKTTHFKGMLRLRRLVVGTALMGADGATVDTVAAVLGYASPNAFYDALAEAGLPSPAAIRDLSRRLR